MGTGDKSGPLHNFPLVLGKLLGRGTGRRVPDLPGASLSLLQTKGSPQSTFLGPLKAKAKATDIHPVSGTQDRVGGSYFSVLQPLLITLSF